MAKFCYEECDESVKFIERLVNVQNIDRNTHFLDGNMPIKIALTGRQF
jgi:hypothetical protein